MIPFQHPSQAARSIKCHPCGTLSKSVIWVTVPMQKRGAEAPAVRDSARRKRGEQKSDQAAVQITTIVSLTEATEGSKKCPVKASRRRSSNGCSLLLTAYGW